MNKLFLIIFLVLPSFFLVGCDFFDDSPTLNITGGNDEIGTQQTDTDSVKQNSVGVEATKRLDSLYTIVKMQQDTIESIQEGLAYAGNYINKVDENVKKLEKNPLAQYFWWIVITLVVVCTIMVITIFNGGKAKMRKIQEFERKIGNLEKELSDIKDAIRQNNSRSKTTSQTTELQEIKSRLSVLENKKDTKPVAIQQRAVSERSSLREQVVAPRTLYFGNAKGDFFNDVYDFYKEEAKFKAVVSGQIAKGRTAQFEPINLDMIRSIDGNNKAVRCRGGQLQTAKDYSIASGNEGVVEYDGSVWKIITPVTIDLK